MKTQMKNTSLEAYYGVKIQEREKSVIEIMKMSGRPMTNKEISNWLNWPINMVTGRVNGLVKKGIAEQADVVRGEFTREIRWRLIK